MVRKKNISTVVDVVDGECRKCAIYLLQSYFDKFIGK